MIKMGLLALTLGAPLSGCVVHERVVAHTAAPCRNGYWIDGHYDRYGRWHGAHWHCPGKPYNVY
jgi:hypothetical protein